jgi:peptidoglycan/xylan/chitin deacetylase (PgdA/CDA1 family)
LSSTIVILKNGHFIISLDFELLWGVRDVRTMESYGKNILGVHELIPKLLDCFNAHGIKATFSTVGFLFLKNKKELKSHIPELLPTYEHQNLSPYNGHFDLIQEDSCTDPYHFAPHLIDLIAAQPHHEIGTHTYCHYYCLEPGQTIDSFRADLKMAQAVAARKNISLQSLVFPRNQFNEAYLKVCSELGIVCYRGNEPSWMYSAASKNQEGPVKRALRLADAYLPISGINSFKTDLINKSLPVNIPASRFLRPYSPKLSFLDGLRLRRIKSDMTYAAKNKEAYHLWWHPHNFGSHQKENLAFLTKILEHYQHLHHRFGFESITMTEMANKIIHG